MGSMLALPLATFQRGRPTLRRAHHRNREPHVLIRSRSHQATLLQLNEKATHIGDRAVARCAAAPLTAPQAVSAPFQNKRPAIDMYRK